MTIYTMLIMEVPVVLLLLWVIAKPKALIATFNFLISSVLIFISKESSFVMTYHCIYASFWVVGTIAYYQFKKLYKPKTSLKYAVYVDHLYQERHRKNAKRAYTWWR